MTDEQRMRGVRLAQSLTDALDWGNADLARGLLGLLRRLVDEPALAVEGQAAGAEIARRTAPMEAGGRTRDRLGDGEGWCEPTIDDDSEATAAVREAREERDEREEEAVERTQTRRP